MAVAVAMVTRKTTHSRFFRSPWTDRACRRGIPSPPHPPLAARARTVQHECARPPGVDTCSGEALVYSRRVTASAPAQVCVLYLGGTIGMVPNDDGHFVPAPGFLGTYLAGLDEIRSGNLPSYDLVELSPLLDSADVGPAEWVKVAEEIVARYSKYDGFVIVHGTDTMAYTASALSFLLRGLGKPVVMTGAQLSVAHPRSDGREHVLTSLIIAGTLAIPEVSIYFGRQLLRGNRTQKVHNQNFVAFDSGNLPPLAQLGASIVRNDPLIRAPGAGLAARLHLPNDPRVMAIRIFPGMTAQMLNDTLATSPHALVLETYGVGNVPCRDPSFLAVLEAMIRDHNLIVVNCSQCHGGYVRPSTYRTGASLAQIGVRSGADMTPEAALTKLYCLLAQGHSAAEVRALIGTDLAGELTEQLTEQRTEQRTEQPRGPQ